MRKTLVVLFLAALVRAQAQMPTLYRQNWINTLSNTPLQCTWGINIDKRRTSFFIDPSFSNISNVVPYTWSGLMNDNTFLTFKLVIRLK